MLGDVPEGAVYFLSNLAWREAPPSERGGRSLKRVNTTWGDA